MSVLSCVQKGTFYLDGGTGTFLQARGLKPGELPEYWNLSKPEEMIELHRAYYEAGSHAVCANTFGANRLKFDGKEGRPTVEEVVSKAVSCVKAARDTAMCGQQEKFIALDVGPLGKLLQPLGDIPFENAVELFAEVICAGARAGVDLILIETMNDSYETKAAVLAAKENCDLPVFVSNVYDDSEKLMSGASPEAMIAMLEGLRVDAIGLNCSLGPNRMLDILPRFLENASVPILVKPNAGLPRFQNGKTIYDVTATDFADTMTQIIKSGARIVGGCCGTTPSYIKKLVDTTKELSCAPVEEKSLTVVSSYTHAVKFGEQPILIGERINPTGKNRFKEALRNHDIDSVLKEGISQQEQGTHILDVNVGLPEIDEATMLAECVCELQSVCNLPLQLDTSNPKAMERALRLYNGKPMINSVNGSDESMNAIFPMVKKYGGVVVCLTLDEQGIPDSAQRRLDIAKRIVQRAKEYGIGVHNLVFDPLALTISSDPTAATVTLQTIPLIHKQLGAHCSLGVSNISFGLPNRDFITSTFFAMALTQGLDAAIMNPYAQEMQKVYHSYLALSGKDHNCSGYIRYAQTIIVENNTTIIKDTHHQTQNASVQNDLQKAIAYGLCEESARLARTALQQLEPLTLINDQIVPALDIVGQGFENKTVFLPQLLMSAEAAKAAFEEVRKKMPVIKEVGPSILLATVKGDIHDIGKNIVKALLQNYGYHVIDLGRDVAPQTIVDTAIKHDVKLVGLSALMTTTVPAMAETIKQLQDQNPSCHVVVGGAVLTQDYANQIRADYYAKNAMETVRYAEKVLKNTKIH